MSANLPANQTMDIIKEAMEAQFSIERSKLLLEHAKSALEVARTAVEVAKAEETNAKSGLDAVLLKGEVLGLSRSVMESLSEKLSSSILSSGLIKVEEIDTVTVAVVEAEQAPVKRRATRTKANEGDVAIQIKEPDAVVEEDASKLPATQESAVLRLHNAEHAHLISHDNVTADEISDNPNVLTEEVTQVAEPTFEVKKHVVTQAEEIAPVATHEVETVMTEVTSEPAPAPFEAPKPLEMLRKQPMFLRSLNNNGVKV